MLKLSLHFSLKWHVHQSKHNWNGAHERAPNIHHNLPYIPSIYAIQNSPFTMFCACSKEQDEYQYIICPWNVHRKLQLLKKNNCSPNIQLTLTRPAKGELTGTDKILHIKITLKLPRLLPVVLLRILSPSLLTLLLNPYCRHTEW